MPRTINYNELTNIIRNEYKNGACSSSSNKTTDKNIFDSMLEYSLFSNLRANIVSFLEIGVSLFSF